MRRGIFISIAFLVMFTKVAFGQNNNFLDKTFNDSGIVILNTGQIDYVNKILLQPDNKIVASGTSDDKFIIIRLDEFGTLDQSFGTNGILKIDFPGYLAKASTMALQNDGKMVIGGEVNDFGYYSFGLARVNPNGQLDSTFGNDGKVITDLGTNFDRIYSIVIQPQGQILAGGESGNDITLVQYLPNGSLDSTFGNNGIVLTHLIGDEYAIRVFLLDGKIMVIGAAIDSLLLVRYNLDGTLDNSFNGMGKIGHYFQNFSPKNAILQPDNKILIASDLNDYQNGLLIRVNKDGTLDSTFNSKGYNNLNIPGEFPSFALAMHPDNSILTVGYYDWFTMCCYTVNKLAPNGIYSNNSSLFKTYISNTTPFIYDMALQPDGKILLAGAAYGGSNTYDILITRNLHNPVVSGIIEDHQQNIKLYPNPVFEQTILEYDLDASEKVTISLFDMQGQLIQEYFIEEIRPAGKSQEILKLNKNIAPGIYILSVNFGEKESKIKLIKN